MAEKLQKYMLDDDIDDLNPYGEYKDLRKPSRAEFDDGFDDNVRELAECGNYQLEENILTEENSYFPNMNLSLVLTKNLVGKNQTGPAWVEALVKRNMRNGTKWCTWKTGTDGRKHDIYWISKGKEYPSSQVLGANVKTSQATEIDKSAVAKWIANRLLDYARAVVEKYGNDPRWSGWDAKNSHKNAMARKFQGFIEKKMRSYFERHQDELMDEAIEKVCNRMLKIQTGFRGAYGNRNQHDWEEAKEKTLSKLCKDVYFNQTPMGAKIDEMSAFICGFINKDRLKALVNTDNPYVKAVMSDDKNLCYFDTEGSTSKRAMSKTGDVLAVCIYVFDEQNKLIKNEESGYGQIWGAIKTNNRNIVDENDYKNLLVPVSRLLIMTDRHFDDQMAATKEEMEALGLVEGDGWWKLLKTLIGLVSNSTAGIRYTVGGNFNSDARNSWEFSDSGDVGYQHVDLNVESDPIDTVDDTSGDVYTRQDDFWTP